MLESKQKVTKVISLVNNGDKSTKYFKSLKLPVGIYRVVLVADSV